MRWALVVALLVACGKVEKIPVDASGTADAALDAPRAVPRLYALTAATFDVTANSKIGLEVIDLTTMTLAHRFDLQFGGVTSMVLSPDAQIAYIGDFANGQIRMVNTVTGLDAGAIPVAGVRDIAISSDGATLFAATGGTITKIDTATRVTKSMAVGTASTTTLAVAVSPDGARLAVPTTDGGTSPAVVLVRTADLSIEATVPITTTVTGCAAFPVAGQFLTASLLLAWDNNCDALYQVDVGTHQQLAGTVATGRDSASASFAQNRFVLSQASRLAYAVREDGKLAVVNPQTATFTDLAGFTDTPFNAQASTDGKQIFIDVAHRFNGGGADTLDVLEAATTNVQHGVYTFTVATQSAVDMAVATSP